MASLKPRPPLGIVTSSSLSKRPPRLLLNGAVQTRGTTRERERERERREGFHARAPFDSGGGVSFWGTMERGGGERERGGPLIHVLRILSYSRGRSLRLRALIK